MTIFNASSEQKHILYDIKYMQFQELSLNSSQMFLQLIFTDRLTPYLIKYHILMVINIFLIVLLTFKWYSFCQAAITDPSIFFLYILASCIAEVSDIIINQEFKINGIILILAANLLILIIILMANCVIFVENYTKYCKNIEPDNGNLKIYRKLYWITTLILAFNHSLPMLAAYTAANLYTLSRETRKS